MNVSDARDLGAFIPKDLDDMGLDPYEFRIYCRLCRRAGAGVARESVESMAEACKMSVRKVQGCLKALIEKELVTFELVTGRPTNYYLA
ncbi:hypothetical protein EON79_23880, partial [bacterium]